MYKESLHQWKATEILWRVVNLTPSYTSNPAIVLLPLSHPKIDVNAYDNNLNTPLRRELRYSLHQAVGVRLRNGKVDVNITSFYSQSVLHLAVERNDSLMTEILLKMKCVDVNLVDNDGDTALKACKRGYATVAELIIKQKTIDYNKSSTRNCSDHL